MPGGGPLQGLRVIEITGLGPAPFCGMLLADMGAEVVCVDRAGPLALDYRTDCCRRGKRSVQLDLKRAEDRETLLQLVERADALFEGFRPGVMERLGLGPEECMARNPRLVYGRMTGWGQDGPLAAAAGHDINYIALTGALHAIGRAGDRPVPPLNLVGDYGGGALFLAFGMVCALLEAARSARGQVVDAAMTDGSALLMALYHSLAAEGRWEGERGNNLFDGGAPFYGVYETSDGAYVSVGALEPQFFAELLEKAGIAAADLGQQYDTGRWAEQRQVLERVFRSRTRQEWCEVLEGSDACFAPVLDLHEAPRHPHNRARGTFIEVDGMTQPGPAPRFSRTPAAVASGPPAPGADAAAVLRDWLGEPPETCA